MTLEENSRQIQQKIALAATVAGRDVNDISLVAVTKYVSADTARQLIDTGISHIGENRVDKFLDKYEHLKDYPVTWHLIGTLQRRKVKEVINLVDYFHALDSLKLAHEIQKRAEKTIKCFLQVNLSGEESKHGFSREELESVLEDLSQLDKISFVGLMTMAPLEATDQELNDLFQATYELKEDLRQKQLPNMPMTELSMGMSGDFPQAIAQGATFLRIGSSFFK